MAGHNVSPTSAAPCRRLCLHGAGVRGPSLTAPRPLGYLRRAELSRSRSQRRHRDHRSPEDLRSRTQEMSDLYSTVPQKEIRLPSGRSSRSPNTVSFSGTVHRGGKAVGRAEKAKRPPGKASQVAVFLWALKGLNLRLPPCEGG